MINNQKMSWVRGSYDTLLTTLVKWYRLYDKGKVITFRKVFDGTEQYIGIAPKEREVELELSEPQMKAIADILSLVYPNTLEANYFTRFYKEKFPHCKKLTGKTRLVKFIIPKHVVKGILDLFLEFRSGRLDFKPRQGIGGSANEKQFIKAGTTKTQGLFADEDELDDMEVQQTLNKLDEIAGDFNPADEFKPSDVSDELYYSLKDDD